MIASRKAKKPVVTAWLVGERDIQPGEHRGLCLLHYTKAVSAHDLRVALPVQGACSLVPSRMQEQTPPAAERLYTCSSGPISCKRLFFFSGVLVNQVTSHVLHPVSNVVSFNKYSATSSSCCASSCPGGYILQTHQLPTPCPEHRSRRPPTNWVIGPERTAETKGKAAQRTGSLLPALVPILGAFLVSQIHPSRLRRGGGQ